MSAREHTRRRMQADDESTVSDIRIGPDGRVHVFGTSREILEALAAIGVRGDAVRLRLGDASGSPCGDRSAAPTIEPPATSVRRP